MPEASFDQGRLLRIGAVMLFMVVLIVLGMNYAKLYALFTQRLVLTQEVIAQDVADSLNQQALSGLGPEKSVATSGVLSRAEVIDPRNHGVVFVDDGKVMMVAGRINEPLSLRSAKLAVEGHNSLVIKNGIAAIAVPLAHEEGSAKNQTVVVEFSMESVHDQGLASLKDMALVALMLFGLSLLILKFAGPLIGTHGIQNVNVQIRQITYMLGGLLLAMHVGIGYASYRSFQRIADQDAALLASAVGQTVVASIERMLPLGAEVSDLTGVDEWLQDKWSDVSRGINAVEVFDTQGKHVWGYTHGPQSPGGQYEFELNNNGEVAGKVRVEVSSPEIAKKSRGLFVEFGMLFLVGGIMIYEGLLAFLAHQIYRSVGTRRLRMPLFLFVFGIELARPAVPMWAQQIPFDASPNFITLAIESVVDSLGGATGRHAVVLASVLPIVGMILCIALTSPLWGWMVAHLGPKFVFAVGGVFGIMGMLKGMLAADVMDLIAARALAGIAFSAVSVSALSYIAGQERWRAQGLAIYLAAYVSAAISGVGIGSLMADRLGYTSTFFVGLTCIGLSMLFMRWLPADLLKIHGGAPLRIDSAFMALIKNKRFMRMILLVTLPLQVIQQGIVFVWMPLAFAKKGESLAMAGMGMMVYFATAYAINQRIGDWVDRSEKPMYFVYAGLGLGAFASMVGYWEFNVYGLVAAMALYGVSWALTFAPLNMINLNLSQEIMGNQNAGFTSGVYRGAERMITVLAPLVLVVLVPEDSARTMFLYVAAMMVVATAIYAGFESRAEKPLT